MPSGHARRVISSAAWRTSSSITSAKPPSAAWSPTASTRASCTPTSDATRRSGIGSGSPTAAGTTPATNARRSNCATRSSAMIPSGSTVLVISRGDDTLLQAGRLPRTSLPTGRGRRLGRAPSRPTARRRSATWRRCVSGGAEYLVVPPTYRWWLSHYDGLRRHLDDAPRAARSDEQGRAIYRLEGHATMNATVSIVIPVHKRAHLTRRCLDGLLAELPGDARRSWSTTPPATTPALLAPTERRSTRSRCPRNAGYARACNEGAAIAAHDALVFLNNDTEPQPGWLRALSRYAREHPVAAVVGAKLLYPTGSVQHAGVVDRSGRLSAQPLRRLARRSSGGQPLAAASGGDRGMHVRETRRLRASRRLRSRIRQLARGCRPVSAGRRRGRRGALLPRGRAHPPGVRLARARGSLPGAASRAGASVGARPCHVTISRSMSRTACSRSSTRSAIRCGSRSHRVSRSTSAASRSSRCCSSPTLARSRSCSRRSCA